MKTTRLMDRDFLVYGAGFLSCIWAGARYGELSKAELLQKGMPHAQAVTQFIDGNANLNHPQVQDVRQVLLELPSLVTAEFDQRTLETVLIDVADGMQKLWRRLNSELLRHPDYNDQIEHLPLAFLSWEKVQEYVELAKRLFDLLKVPVDDANLRAAFYEFAAQQVWHYGLCRRSKAVGDIVYASSMFVPDISGFGIDEYRHLMMSPSAQEKLAQQFAQDGIGSFEQIHALNQTYRDGQSQTSRYETAQRLVALMS